MCILMLYKNLECVEVRGYICRKYRWCLNDVNGNINGVLRGICENMLKNLFNGYDLIILIILFKICIIIYCFCF